MFHSAGCSSHRPFVSTTASLLIPSLARAMPCDAAARHASLPAVRCLPQCVLHRHPAEQRDRGQAHPSFSAPFVHEAISRRPTCMPISRSPLPRLPAIHSSRSSTPPDRILAQPLTSLVSDFCCRRRPLYRRYSCTLPVLCPGV